MNCDLCCGTADQIFELLKASRRVIEAMRENGNYLHLMKHYDLNKEAEFRVFIKNGVVKGVSQRDCTKCFNFLAGATDVRTLAVEKAEWLVQQM